ncbi:SusE domain-containing protein [Desertivirga brevis]|uniref:SusE domain-containing protein n=1 Tax=Desertivirga brevis TaxID=2810310 RepID=UPI001A977617|nr:SusE domain-containing protein [Pedobacter sp. SYSU D00873]
MKKSLSAVLLMILFSCLFIGCEKDIEQKVLLSPTNVPGFTTSTQSLVLSTTNDNSKVVTFKFNKPDYGVRVVPSFTLQFDVPSDTTGSNAWAKAVEVKLSGDSTEKSYTGKEFNSLLVNQLKLPTGTQSTLVVRLKSDINQPSGDASPVKPVYSVVTMAVTPYKVEIIYPALMVVNGDGWATPIERTNGFVLTSSGFNNKYEGYLYLPNANGWGGDGFKLKSTVTGKVYGWGSATTIAEGATGNLWLSPAPNYVKVNVDLETNSLSFTPVRFYITGDNNSWSTTATPMTYDNVTKKWVARNVSLTAGNKFAFTANGGWDITYKVNKTNQLQFAGAPVWDNGPDPNSKDDDSVNITAPSTGVFTITLDLSQGDGKYTYSIE